MVKYIQTRFILAAAIVFVSCSYSAFANEPDSPAAKFLAHGREALMQGKPAVAVNDFSRAILIDVYNQEAQKQLITIARTQELRDVKLKTQLLVFEDLIGYINNLQQKASYFEAKRDALGSEIIESGYDTAALKNEMRRIAASVKAAEPPVGAAKETEVNPLDAVIDTLSLERNKLTTTIKIFKKQYDWITSLQAEAQEILTRKTLLDPMKPAVTKAAPPQPQKIEKIDELGSLKEQITDLNQKINRLIVTVEQKDDKLNQLSSQVVDLSLRLSEKETALTTNYDNLADIYQELIDLESRVELGQRIIQEKDTRILALEEKVNTWQTNNQDWRNEFNDVLKSKDEKLLEINGILQIYKAKLSNSSRAIRSNSESIASLENQLALTETKLFEKDIIMEKTKDELVKIDNKLENIQSKIKFIKQNNLWDQGQRKIVEDEVLSLQNKLEKIHQYLAKKLKQYQSNTSSYVIE